MMGLLPNVPHDAMIKADEIIAELGAIRRLLERLLTLEEAR